MKGRHARGGMTCARRKGRKRDLGNGRRPTAMKNQNCSTPTWARCLATHTSRSARADVHGRAGRKPRERARPINTLASGTGGHTHTLQHRTTHATCGKGSTSKTSQPPRLNKKRRPAKNKQARMQARLKEGSKKANKQGSKEASKPVTAQACRRASMQAYKQAGRRASAQVRKDT